MGLAERVVHFGEHRAHGAVAVVADPERHRIEDIAQHARERIEHDFAVRGDALALQQRANPCFERRSVARAVVALVERHETAPVAADAASRQRRQPRQRQAQAERRIGERVGGGARAPVHHVAHRRRTAVDVAQRAAAPRGLRPSGTRATARHSIRRASHAATFSTAARPGSVTRDAFRHRVRGVEPILVKAVPQPRAGVPRVPLSLQMGERVLRRQRAAVEQRMRVLELAQPMLAARARTADSGSPRTGVRQGNGCSLLMRYDTATGRAPSASSVAR